jgi:hypothetical protein
MIQLWWLDRAMAVFEHCFLSAGIAIDNLLRSLGVVIGGVCFTLLRVTNLFGWVLFYLLLWLCVSLMSRLVLDICCFRDLV